MKKIILLWMAICCIGCVTVNIPKYIKDESPYKKKFYASFEKTMLATTNVLEGLGWKVTGTANPANYDREKDIKNNNIKQTLIFVEVKQTPLFVSSRYTNLNIFLRSDEQSTDMEIRYLAVTPAFFKDMQSHKNDKAVGKIFDRIEEILKETP